MVSNAHKLLRSRSHEFFLIQARTASLDAIQFLVHFVGAVERDVNHGVPGQRIVLDVLQSCVVDYFPRLVACGDELDLLNAGIFESLDGFHDVDYGRAGTDADVARGGIEMASHRTYGGGSFGGFDGGRGIEG